ncbi:hypothetical protein H6F53_13340 [Trichocoleus sp. FACHB-832]|uniref:hypothetical protein n=1 Tax=Trichocoleus sp. FACHB-832 TaxID=2692875 RepID=UPI0016854C37|nr:hypothetical protein [Trichocoleus sp. FACHB-832]MBD1906461.1 hypothetical protein [Trichocoleus sp. FACHB-832]
MEIKTAIALKTSERRSQASLDRELEVETASAICSRGMHCTHYKRIAKIELRAISAYLFKTDPAAMKGAIASLQKQRRKVEVKLAGCDLRGDLWL